jgi:RNA polymerase sigma-70 factor (ECF subfamily)
MQTLPAAAERDQPSDPDRSLADLIEQVALGHREAFGELYSRTSWKVFGLCNAIIRDVGHAEEVTQEVFLEIWQRAAGFDRSRGSASGFVMRLTHSRSVDRVRHINNSRVRDGTYVRREFRPDADSVIADVVLHDEVRQLRAAVAGLTTLQREAITLTFLVGHTNRAASDLLGIPLSTLKTRVRDGVRALRCASPELVT